MTKILGRRKSARTAQCRKHGANPQNYAIEIFHGQKRRNYGQQRRNDGQNGAFQHQNLKWCLFPKERPMPEIPIR